MYKSETIPFEWTHYMNHPVYFVTYFGDIYHGYITTCKNTDDSFFIISKNEAKAFQSLASNEKTPEKLRELGWEIKDRRIIKQIISDEAFPKNENTSSNSERTISGQHQFHKMFVFGAAASTFCVFGDRAKHFRSSELNPPTGFEIFDEKYEKYCRKYPGVMQSVSNFEAKGKDIEACMEEEWQQFNSTFNPEVTTRHINIQYFMRELFQDISAYVEKEHWRNNLYSLFANKLQKFTTEEPDQRIGLVSFNYDTILETFIKHAFRLNFNSLEDYINSTERNILLFKPHGSSNWGWRFSPEAERKKGQKITAEYLYDRKTHLDQIYFELLGAISSTVYTKSWGLEKLLHGKGLGRYTINKNLLQVMSPNQNDDYFPALLLPYRDKDEFVMPYDHYYTMRQFFGEMEELYLIGWKGNELLFNRQLGKYATKLRKLVIVNPNPEEVLEHLQTQAGLDLNRYEVVKVKDFEQFVLEEMDKTLQP